MKNFKLKLLTAGLASIILSASILPSSLVYAAE